MHLSFLKRLLLFITCERPAELMDGRLLRGLRRAFIGRNLQQTDVSFWREVLSPSLEPNAAERVARLLEILRVRDDFPRLTSMVKWGLPKWEELFSQLGIDRREARTFVALVVGREEYLPAGHAYERIYRRLGIILDREGVPRPHSFNPEDMRDLRWQLAALAHHRCTEEIDPGGPICELCPALRFCESARAKRFKPRQGPEFIDVFAGGGGMSLGFSLAGFRQAAAIELDTHAADTLYFNRPELGREGVLISDAEDLATGSWIKENRGIPVLVGGPPCQPFSIVHRHNHPDIRDERRFLFRPFLQMARGLQARLVVMENVPGIRSAADGDTVDRVTDEFRRAGFEVDHKVLDASDFGVPQHRRRIFFVGANKTLYKDGSKVIEHFWEALEEEKVASPVTVGEAFSGVPRIAAGTGGLAVRKRPGKRSSYAHTVSNSTRYAFNHEARRHNPRDLRIFRLLKRGEIARELEDRLPGTIPYQTESFRDKYRKLRLNEPSPTIPAHLSRDANSFIHPIVPRGITCREAARLQTFPDDYVFFGGSGPAFIQTGNAVPPLLAKAVAKAAMSILPSSLMPQAE